MAALQKIRSKSGLLIGVIAVGLLAFVFPWNEISSFFQRSKDKAFTVDGEVVTTGKYMERIAQWENFQKIISNQNSLDETTSSQIRERVYQQMVKEIMLDSEAKKLGLAVTKEELTDMVYGVNISPALYQIPFFANPQTGQFDKQYLDLFLSDINADPTNLGDEDKARLVAKKEFWAFLENMIKYQRLEEKYASLVAGSVLVSNTEANAMHDDSKSVANIAYVLQPYTSLSDSAVQVTESEIKSLYDQRKNNFKLDAPLRKISYFVKDVVPSDEDYAVVEKEIVAVREKLAVTTNPALLVNDHSSSPYTDAFISTSSLPTDAKEFVKSAQVNDIYGPVREGQAYVMYKLIDRTVASDSINLQMIPLPETLNEQSASQIADSLYNVLKSGKDFAALANEIQPGSNGGNIGWATEMMLTNSGIAKQTFAAAKGEILKLPLNGRTQLFKIADKTSPVEKVKLAVIQMPVIISDKTQNAIDNELNQFMSEGGNAANFDKAALSKGYDLVSDAVVNPSDIALGQTPNSRFVINWAFNNKVGTVHKFDNISSKRILAVIKSEIDGDYMPVSEVSTILKAELINDKKAEKIISDLKSKNLTSLESYASAISGRVDTANFVTFATNSITGGVGYEPALNVVAKLGQTNKLQAPTKGKSGVYVTNVISKTEDNKAFAPEQIKQSIRQSNFYMLASQSIFALMDKLKVEDNRVAFF